MNNCQLCFILLFPTFRYEGEEEKFDKNHVQFFINLKKTLADLQIYQNRFIPTAPFLYLPF